MPEAIFSSTIQTQAPVRATSGSITRESSAPRSEILSPAVDQIVASRPQLPDLRTAVTALVGAVGNTAKGEAANAALAQRYRLKAVEPDAARGKTTNAMIVDTTGGRVKDGKPVGTWIVRSDAPHRGAPMHHLNLRKDVLGKNDPHTPISPGMYRVAGVAAPVVEGAEKVALPVALTIDGARLASAFAADGDRIGAHTIETGTGVASGWVGAAAGSAIGAEGGAMLGGAIGALCGGVGAVPGAAIGTVAGGAVGGIAGAFGGSIAAEHFAAVWKR